MTTTLANDIKIVGKPYYYLEQEPASINAAYATTSTDTLKTYYFRNTRISCKFKLTKVYPIAKYNELIKISSVGNTVNIYFKNGYLGTEYGGNAYVSYFSSFELNKWYVVTIAYIDSMLHIEIRDENGGLLSNDSWEISSLDRKMLLVRFCVGGPYGVLVSRDSKVTNTEGEVLADLSDLTWDWVSSFGTTNAI